MKAGKFNMQEYLNKLNESFENEENKEVSNSSLKDGIIIPEENKKIFNWLKKEFQQNREEPKVEVKGAISQAFKSENSLGPKDEKPSTSFKSNDNSVNNNTKDKVDDKNSVNFNKSETFNKPKDNKSKDSESEEKDTKDTKDTKETDKETSIESKPKNVKKIDLKVKKNE